MSRKIRIGIPNRGNISVHTMQCLFRDIQLLKDRGDDAIIDTDVRLTDLYEARAHLVARFLEDKSSTDLFMVDTDITWPHGAMLRLVDHDVEMVCGCYPYRELPHRFVALADGPVDIDKNGLGKLQGVGFGFVRMRRSMLEKMTKHYHNSLGVRFCDLYHYVRLFDPHWSENSNGEKIVKGEDISFCQRWIDIGGEVYVDATIDMGHIGPHEFRGRLLDLAGDQLGVL